MNAIGSAFDVVFSLGGVDFCFARGVLGLAIGLPVLQSGRVTDGLVQEYRIRS